MTTTKQKKKKVSDKQGKARTEFCFSGTVRIDKQTIMIQGDNQVNHSDMYIDDKKNVFGASTFILEEGERDTVLTVSPKETELLLKLLGLV